MISLARIRCIIGSGNQEPITSVNRVLKNNIRAEQALSFDRSGDLVDALPGATEIGGFAQVLKHTMTVDQAPTCGRSGAAGDAVRGRSLSPWPVAQQIVWRALRAQCRHLTLTPARWDAIRLACQLVDTAGSGAAVTVVTAMKPICNRQLSDNASFFAPVTRLQACASRHVRVGACAHTRAYTRAHVHEITCNSVTVSIYVYNTVGCRLQSGYVEVTLVTRGRCRRIGADRAQPSGYSGRRKPQGLLDRAANGVLLARAAETFGVSVARRASRMALIGVAAPLDQGEALIGKNGGFLRFPTLASGYVGRAMLEGSTEGRGNAGFSWTVRKPVRLVAAAAGRPGAALAIGPEAPPLPPSRARAAPSTVGREAARISNGFPVGTLDSRDGTNRAGAAQSLARRNGSGFGKDRRRIRNAAAGLGLGMTGIPRRWADASEGAARVN